MRVALCASLLVGCTSAHLSVDGGADATDNIDAETLDATPATDAPDALDAAPARDAPDAADGCTTCADAGDACAGSACTFGWTRTGEAVSRYAAIDLEDTGLIHLVGVFVGERDFDPGPGEERRSAPNGAVFSSVLSSLGDYVGVGVIDWGVSSIVPYSVVRRTDGDLYVGGSTCPPCDFGVDLDPGPGRIDHPTGGDYFIVRVRRDGTGAWARVLPTGGGGLDDERLPPPPLLVLDDIGGVFAAWSVYTAPGAHLGTGVAYQSFAETGAVRWLEMQETTASDDYSTPAALSRGAPFCATGLANAAADRSIDLDPTGGSDPLPGGIRVWLTCLDADGAYLGSVTLLTGVITSCRVVASPTRAGVLVGCTLTASADLDPAASIDVRSPVDGVDAFVLHLDAALRRSWVWVSESTGIDTLTDIAVTDSGRIFVATASGLTATIVELEPTGAEHWRTTLPATVFDVEASDVVGLLLHGYYRGPTDFDPGEGLDERVLPTGLSFDHFLTRWSLDGSY